MHTNNNNDVFIIIDRIFTLDGAKKTIGGIQTYLETLSELIFDQYNVKPIILQKAQVDFKIELEKFKVHGYFCKTKKFSLELFNKIGDYKVNNNDVLLIWGSDQYSLKQSQYKSINIQHGIGFDTEAVDSKSKRFIVDSKFVPIYKFLQRWMARKYIKAGDRVVCVDYNFKNWIRTYISKGKNRFVVIPNFSKIKFKIINNKLNNNRIKIVISRRFVKRRGIDLAIDCAKKVLAKNSNVHFTFAGSGNQINIIEKLKTIYPNNITITSYSQEQSLDFHRDFHIAMVPSIGSEGTSLSLLEAMSVGCLVICTDIGGMSNIVLDNHNGFIVAPVEKELSGALLKVITSFDSYDYIRINAMKTIENTFNYKLWASKGIKVIDEVM
jgi:glycosyltransferase involved in cell wall biosynthesis